MSNGMKRFITALVLVVIVAPFVVLGKGWFDAFIVVVTTWGMYELLKVKKVKPEDTKYVNVNATPVINNEGETSVIVVEESRG